jgi:RES domain-containing protein
LAILDLTDPDVRQAIGITEDELRSDDLTRCQQLADAARAAGFEGILAPSAALRGEQTLAIFSEFLDKVEEEHSRIQRPPVRMRDLLRYIRLPDRASDELKRLFRRLARRP